MLLLDCVVAVNAARHRSVASAAGYEQLFVGVLLRSEPWLRYPVAETALQPPDLVL